MQPSISEMRSRLWAHLRSLAPANRHTDLATGDYLQARYAALGERCEFSSAHQHVSMGDVEEYADPRLIDDVNAYLMTGDEEAMRRGWQRLCDALTQAANVTIDNRLREIRRLRMAGMRTTAPPEFVPAVREPTEHDADYLAERLAERHADLERARNFMEEVGMRS